MITGRTRRMATVIAMQNPAIMLTRSREIFLAQVEQLPCQVDGRGLPSVTTTMLKMKEAEDKITVQEVRVRLGSRNNALY